MLTIRAATTLLAEANANADANALNPIARAIGFDTPMIPVSPTAQLELGIRQLVSTAHVARGTGNMRLLAAHLANSSADARELTRRLCHALTYQAPTRHWCALTLSANSHTLCIATVTPHPNGPRIAALQVDRRHIVDSDADTLRALAAAPRDNDRLCHARFTDILKRDALSARFYHTLEQLVHQLARTAKGPATNEERDELALLCASRLLFLAFLEAKGWLAGNRGFLLQHCAQHLQSGGHLHDKFLRPLFFGTLNTPLRQRAATARAFGAIPFLNGGLFATTPLEQRRRNTQFSDDAITALIGELLDRFRFTAREESSSWSEAAVDPEMLGRAFECLMASDERRRSGSFYTPPTLVEQAVNDALCAAIPTLPASALSGSHPNEPLHLPPPLRAELKALRILDPACGSGAFLVHILEHLANLHTRAGDAQPTHTLRREILTRSIFGVDRNPMAVWLCELRLWLSVVIECPETHPAKIPPLPNLDHHIRVGDTLAGGDLRFATHSAHALTQLRTRYTLATGRRKRNLATLLDREERQRAIAECDRMIASTYNDRAELVSAVRTPDLFGERRPPSHSRRSQLLQLRTRLREQRARRHKLALGSALPFRFNVHFADIADSGGFHIILGNPPWVRPHHLPIAERTRLRLEYRTLRDAPWRTGATRAGAGAGFSAQADLAVAFVERATTLLQPNGVLSLLLPTKLWRALAGGGVRRFLNEHTNIHTLRDWSDAPSLFEASVYPSLLVATRKGLTTPAATPPTHVVVAHQHREHTFSIPANSLPMGGDPAAPWLLLPPEARTTFDKLRRSGPALGDSPLGRPLLGVKCGCNAAFLVHVIEHDDDTAATHINGHEQLLERALLRPALRGEAIGPLTRDGHTTSRQKTASADLRIVWTHGPDGNPLRSLPPRINRWLARFRPQLESRRDARARQPWWTLFRTEAARHEAPRLVWADLGKRLRTTILQPGDPTVPLNSCYVLRTPSLTDAYALNVLLTSPIAAAWLDALAEPARGGYRRFLGWTVAALPIPDNWLTARLALADLALREEQGDPPSPDEHLHVTADAYGIAPRALAPLMEWRSNT